MNTIGNGRAEATLLGGSSLATPVLKAEAHSCGPPAGRQTQSTTTGIEGYTYTGDAPKEFTLTSTLTASVKAGSSSGKHTSVEAPVYLFTEQGFFFSADLPTLKLESDAEGVGFLERYEEPGDDQREGTISFTLNPGESVYLWTQPIFRISARTTCLRHTAASR